MVTSNLAFKEKNSIEPEVVVNESPVKWCAVALSDVVARGKRLEASVFDVEAKQAYMLLTHGKYPAVNLISKNGPVEKAYYGLGFMLKNLFFSPAFCPKACIPDGNRVLY